MSDKVPTTVIPNTSSVRLPSSSPRPVRKQSQGNTDKSRGRIRLTSLSRLIPFLVIGVLWETASVLGWIDPFTLPSISKVGETLWQELFVTGLLWPDIAATLTRSLSGLALGALLGILLGLIMGQSKLVAHFVEPLIAFTFPMPKLALFPLLMVLMGIGDGSKIAMVTLGAFFPLVVSTYAGVRSVPRVLIWNASTLGASKLQILGRVVFPATLPHIFSGFRIASSTSFLLVVAAEMISANNGLGYSIVFSQRNFRPDLMMAGILVVATLGFILDRLVTVASERTLAWQDSARS